MKETIETGLECRLFTPIAVLSGDCPVRFQLIRGSYGPAAGPMLARSTLRLPPESKNPPHTHRVGSMTNLKQTIGGGAGLVRMVKNHFKFVLMFILGKGGAVPRSVPCLLIIQSKKFTLAESVEKETGCCLKTNRQQSRNPWHLSKAKSKLKGPGSQAYESLTTALAACSAEQVNLDTCCARHLCHHR